MDFSIEMIYDHKALLAMAKSVRMTMRAKYVKRGYFIMAAVLLMGAAILIKDIVTKTVGLTTLIAVVAAVAIVFYIHFEDKITAHKSKKNMESGFALKVFFNDEFYTSVTEGATIDWKYTDVQALAKTDSYIAFVLSANQAQAFDTNGLKGGSLEQFIAFIEEKTGKKVQEI